MTSTVWRIVPFTLAFGLLAGPAVAAVQAGVSAAVRGQVDLLPVVEKVKHEAKSGEDVFLGDEISSFDESGMQLMLLDETIFTIGPNTDLTVDEFVYDPATDAGQVTASLAKGVLRFVTGKVADAAPQNMEIRLPVGTIGVRGTTIGAAQYDGTQALIVLLGPGLDNNADARAGRLDVTAAGVTVSLTRPRFGTTIEFGQPPAPPFQLTDVQLASILTPLAPEPEPGEPMESAGSATSFAGQDIAEATISAEFAAATNETGVELNDSFDPIELESIEESILRKR
ncbi:MAG: FecR domain-containing protein [Alphaproteobacteria bacterium]